MTHKEDAASVLLNKPPQYLPTSAQLGFPGQGHNPESVSELFTVDTDEFADINLVKGQSVRKRYSQTGSYFGIRPLKLANGRLKWPHVIATKSGGHVANGSTAKTASENEVRHG